MAIPATVQAAVKCDGTASSHIDSSQTHIEIVDGKLSVTIQVELELKDAKFDLYVFSKQLVKDGEDDFYPILDPSRVAEKEYLTDSGVYTFDGLADGTYYVYCGVEDKADSDENNPIWHDPMYLGSVSLNSSSSGGSSSNSSSSGSASSNSNNNAQGTVSVEEKVESQIEAAESGATVILDEGINTLSNSAMKQLLAKGDVSLRMEFTYEDKEYVIIIPAGAALDNDIEWYGPLYLAQHFGNSAGTAGSGAGGTYEVKSGDCLSRIAAANNMTLQQLLAKNPQIKDPNKIVAGQKINR